MKQGEPMNAPTQALHALGQSLWLDQISHDLLRSGTLKRYIHELSITGLTSNPTIFEQAFAGSAYDARIAALVAHGLADEALFFALALEDLRVAADDFRPVFEASQGVDGWVSLEVSPLLADNTAHTIQAAHRLFDEADRANLFIKVPGTPEGLRAVEELIFDGVPVNVTLLFSREQWQAAVEAHARGLARRLAAGLHLNVASVASLFVSRWDVAMAAELPAPFHNRLGIAMAMRAYRAHVDWLASPRWQALAAAGARPQRLLWASTGTKDPAAPDTLYVQALAAPGTINTLPEATLLAFADHGRVDAPMATDGGYADAVLDEFRREGVDDEVLALQLQQAGVEAFATSWHAMLSRIREKCAGAEARAQAPLSQLAPSA